MSNKKAVLIADESLSVVQLYKGLLAAYGCIVHTVSNIAEAKERMRHYNYDLYIIDTVLENDEDGTTLVGRGGADPHKCLILSGNLPEEAVEELTSFHKVPRSMIMVKPPDVTAFITIANKYLAGIESPDTIVLADRESTRTAPINIKEISRTQKIKTWFSSLSLKGWMALISFMLLLPTTLKTTGTYIGYKQHVKFENARASYCADKFDDFTAGNEITQNHYVEQIIVHSDTNYVVRFYPNNIIYIKMLTKNCGMVEYWVVGDSYLNTIGLNKDMSFIDIIKTSIGF